LLIGTSGQSADVRRLVAIAIGAELDSGAGALGIVARGRAVGCRSKQRRVVVVGNATTAAA
jgi:hypothetical protein